MIWRLSLLVYIVTASAALVHAGPINPMTTPVLDSLSRMAGGAVVESQNAPDGVPVAATDINGDLIRWDTLLGANKMEKRAISEQAFQIALKWFGRNLPPIPEAGSAGNPPHAYYYLTRKEYDKDRCKEGEELRLKMGWAEKRAGGFWDAPLGLKPVVGLKQVGRYVLETTCKDRHWLVPRLLKEGLKQSRRLPHGDSESTGYVYLVIRTEGWKLMPDLLMDKFINILQTPDGDRLPYTKDDVCLIPTHGTVVVRIPQPL